eukprot:gene21664-biopygen23647
MVFCIGDQTFFPRAFAATPANGTPFAAPLDVTCAAARAARRPPPPRPPPPVFSPGGAAEKFFTRALRRAQGKKTGPEAGKYRAVAVSGAKPEDPLQKVEYPQKLFICTMSGKQNQLLVGSSPQRGAVALACIIHTYRCWTPQPCQPPGIASPPGIANPALARVSGSQRRKRISAHKAARRQMLRGPGLTGSSGHKRRIAKSAPARVSGAEWRKRISAHKAAVRQMHCAPGPAGAQQDECSNLPTNPNAAATMAASGPTSPTYRTARNPNAAAMMAASGRTSPTYRSGTMQALGAGNPQMTARVVPSRRSDHGFPATPFHAVVTASQVWPTLQKDTHTQRTTVRCHKKKAPGDRQRGRKKTLRPKLENRGVKAQGRPRQCPGRPLGPRGRGSAAAGRPARVW